MQAPSILPAPLPSLGDSGENMALAFSLGKNCRATKPNEKMKTNKHKRQVQIPIAVIFDQEGFVVGAKLSNLSMWSAAMTIKAAKRKKKNFHAEKVSCTITYACLEKMFKAAFNS